jgi:phosphate transport system substrate-binding protein
VALVAAVILAWVSGAAAQSPAAPELRIGVSDTGQAIFDGFVPALAEVSGLANPPVVIHASALGVLRDFCRGVGGNSPDVVLTTRRLRPSLASDCQAHGVDHMVKIELGHGALVLAVRRESALRHLSAHDVYLALARDIPDKDEFRRNTNIRWSDIDASLPQEDIRFQLPPREDGGRVEFDGLILEGGCREEPLVKVIFAVDQRTSRCVTTRVDRVREIPPSQDVRALVDAPVGTIGVLSLRDIAQTNGQLVPLALDGVMPDAKTVLDGSYDYASPYWLYAKRGQAARGRAPAIDAAVDRIITAALSEQALGTGGVLSKLGLVPLPPDVRQEQRALFAARANPYGVGPVIEWISFAASGARALVELALNSSSNTEAPVGLDFTKLMDIAGYQTLEFQTDVGLFPGAGMTFGIAREMSEADQAYLERRLEADAHARPGPLASMQRKIVRSVLDVSEGGTYELSQVQIELLPLPSFKFVVTPKDAPVSEDTMSILRAIERLGNRVSEMSQ